MDKPLSGFGCACSESYSRRVTTRLDAKDRSTTEWAIKYELDIGSLAYDHRERRGLPVELGCQ